MRNLFRKIAIIPAFIFPFLFLTLSFCCLRMANADAHSMADCCFSMGTSNGIQQGLNFNGSAPHSSKCHCEQLTEAYDKAGLKSVDFQRTISNHPKAIFFSQNQSHIVLTAFSFFNYRSPPKVVQNPLPLYLQISVLRL